MIAATVSAFVVRKAERLLVEGRVEVTCSEDGLAATVKGDTGTHRLVREGDSWRCTCPARGRCSHVEALERVT